MSIFGSPAPTPVAGAAQSAIAGAAQADRADRKRPLAPARTAGAKRAADGLDLDVTATETADAVRDLKGNDQEEAHEDRREHEGYAPDGGEGAGPHIDVNA